MSSWKFRKPESTDICGICVVCLRNKQKQKVIKQKVKYLPYCNSCQKKLFGNGLRKKKIKIYPRKYGNYIKKDTCDSCGFKAVHRCQLDVDHIDGDNRNNSEENLQTLCANCHRLKTWIYEDYRTPP